MTTHPKLDAAIKAGEVKQCPHCGCYYVPEHITHRCLGMAEAELQELKNKLRELAK